MPMIYVALFLLGLVGSWCSTRVVQAIDAALPIRAFLFDLLAIETGMLGLQLWGDREMDFWLLQAETLGLALGTFIAVKWGKS